MVFRFVINKTRVNSIICKGPRNHVVGARPYIHNVMIDRSIHVCYIAYYFTVFKHTTVAFMCPKGKKIKIEHINDKRKCEIH